MWVRLHNKPNTIGGTCLEVSTSNTRILFDPGIELTSDVPVRPDIPGLFRGDDRPAPDAVVVSHAHPDHYEYLKDIKPGIPIYMSPGTLELIRCASMFDQTKYRPGRVEFIGSRNNPFRVGDVTIRHFLIDHSAPDARAFLVESGGKRLFYTGDFRGHGRKAFTFDYICEHVRDKVDCLVAEGTNIDRLESSLYTEDDVSRTFESFFVTARPTYVSYSAPNIDRFVSIYKACLKTGRILVLDAYSAYILARMRKVLRSKGLPDHTADSIRVHVDRHPYNRRLARLGKLSGLRSTQIDYAELKRIKESCVIVDNGQRRKQFPAHGLYKGAQLLYSRWRGYLERDPELFRFWDDLGVRVYHVHTSGHATLEALNRLVAALNPAIVVPVHTQHAEKFRDVFADRSIVLDKEIEL